MHNELHFIHDGLEYTAKCDTGVVRVYQDDHLIATAEYDDMAECVYYSYVTEKEGAIQDGAIPDMYSKNELELAAWLAGTHPCLYG